ncbi:MAG: HEAT repeat domain-containing protein [Planctomycetes bacterium]|nr:HEAT repeat domain-containing protein [Planctomycetota bacterium]
MSVRLQSGAALAMAAALAVLFVVLLVRQARRYAETASAGDAAPAAVESGGRDGPATGIRAPFGEPTDPDPYRRPERKRFSGKYVRWNLGELPEGWDDEIAERLHGLFDALEHDHLTIGQLTETVEAAYNEISEYLASLGPEAIPTLAAILGAEPDFVARRKIFQAIGKLGPRSDEATYVLRDFFFARIGESARRTSEMIRVIEAMGYLQNQTSFDLLTDLTARPDLQPYQGDFIKALGNHPRAGEAIDVFVDSMQNSPAFNTRNDAAQALGKVRDPETLPHLFDAFQRERVWYAKQTILGSIGKIGDPQAIPFLEKQAVEAPESGVRLSAASAIRRIVEQTGDPYGRSVLRVLAAEERDEGVRGHIQRWNQDL